MTTKRHDELKKHEDEVRREEAAHRQQEEAKRQQDEAKRQQDVDPAKPGTATDDPMATPTWPVHGPNPPSEPKE